MAKKRRLYTLELLTRRLDYRQVETFEFRPREPIPFRAGQYVHLVAPGAQVCPAMVRHMSVASSPRESTLTFSMDLNSKSEYKAAWMSLAIGDEVSLFGISGNFTLPWYLPLTPVVFLAGGIGITPVRSLVRHLHLTKSLRPWGLIHVGHHHLYAEEWAEETGSIQKIGRHEVPRAMDHAVGNMPQALWFISGSRTFVEAMKAHLVQRQVPAGRIKTEDFDH